MSMASTSEVLEKKFRVSEVAEILNVSKMTVHRLITRKELRGYHIGRNVVIPMSSLREFLGESLIEPEEEEK